MTPIFHPLPSAIVAHFRNGGADAHGQIPERRVSDGDGVPCRASMQMVPAGAAYLVLAHRPFATLNPYAETGPIFVSQDMPLAQPGPDLPAFLVSPRYILRGYSADDRIVYGTGAIVETGDLIAASAALLARDDIAYAHIRSATNNCFHCRVERA
ncbi:MAG: DUF1203 domain-containing protein [Paracoccaceae bacterium]